MGNSLGYPEFLAVRMIGKQRNSGIIRPPHAYFCCTATPCRLRPSPVYCFAGSKCGHSAKANGTVRAIPLQSGRCRRPGSDLRSRCWDCLKGQDRNQTAASSAAVAAVIPKPCAPDFAEVVPMTAGAMAQIETLPNGALHVMTLLTNNCRHAAIGAPGGVWAS